MDEERLLKNIRFVAKIVFLIAIVLFGFSLYFKDKLPDQKDILPQLYTEPVQTPVELPSFERERKGVLWTVQPLYDYELYGLVVSYHHIGVWWDVDRSKSDLNTKDICVIWGNNIKSGVYKIMNFSNGSFSANPEYPMNMRYEDKKRCYSEYRNEYLSNNHILPADKEQEKLIMSAGRGDQIYLKGYLVKYTRDLWRGWWRGSSVTRTDEGRGACETIYVTDFKVIKKYKSIWRVIFRISKYLMVITAGLLLFCFFNLPVEYREE